ncbi:unnamed protein product [Aphanomyces euteiches]
MRDHHFQMIHNKDCVRWKERRLVHYKVHGGQLLELSEPSVYSKRSQHLASSWHFRKSSIGHEPKIRFLDAVEFDIVQEKWTILQQQPSPGLRFDHSSAARPAMHEIYVFGGTILTMSILGADYTQTNDLWKLDTVAEKWSQVQVATPVAPIPRSEATAVAVGNDSLVVFGGVVVPTINSYPIDLSDLWSFSYDAKTWTQLGPTNKLVAPLTRFSHASTTLTVNGVLYVADVPQVWTELNAYPPFDRIFTQVLTGPSGVWTFGGLNFVGQNQDSAIAYADTIYAPSNNLPQLDLLYDYAVDLVLAAVHVCH